MFKIIATAIDRGTRRAELEARARHQLSAEMPGTPDEVAEALVRNRMNWRRRIAVLDNAARTSWLACALIILAVLLALIWQS